MVAGFGLVCAASGFLGCGAARREPVIDLGQARAAGWTNDLAWAPDSQTLYFTPSEDPRVHALDVSGGPASPLGDAVMAFATISRDATALFYLDPSGKSNDVTPLLVKAPLSGTRIGPAAPVASDVSNQYIVSANGNQVVFLDYSEQLHFVDISSGHTVTFPGAYPIAFAPDEKSLLAQSYSPHQTFMLDLTTGARVPVLIDSPFARVTRWDGDTPRAFIDPAGVTDLVTGEQRGLPAVGKVAALGGDPYRPTHAFVWRSFCIQEEETGGGFFGGERFVNCMVQQFQLHRIDLETYADDVVAQAAAYSTATALSPDGRWIANAVPAGPSGGPTVYLKEMSAASP